MWAIFESRNFKSEYMIKLYEVEFVADHTEKYKRFEIIKPICGTFYSLKKGEEHLVEQSLLFDTLEDALNKIRELVFNAIFIHDMTIYKEHILVKSFNKVEK